MPTSANTFFVAIEGLDGSGKTQISRHLAHILQHTHGDHVTVTFEPHDPSVAGVFIRQVLTKQIKTDPHTLALAFALNRLDHNARVVTPGLAQDESIVLTDRYYLSSLVYQSTGGLTIDDVMTLNQWARRPDLILFLNVRTDICYERMRKRPQDRELFEQNLDATRDKYLQAMTFLRQRGDKVMEVDANPDFVSVLNNVLDALSEHGPDWLRIQRPLMETPLEGFGFAKVGPSSQTLDTLIDRFVGWWQAQSTPQANRDDLILRLRAEIFQSAAVMSYDEVGLLFLAFLQRQGYVLGDRLQWSEANAYNLTYTLPLGMTQRGTALLLDSSQRTDFVTRLVLDALVEQSERHDIEQLSDFLFVLDARPLPDAPRSYLRDSSADGGKLVPNVRFIQRHDLVDLLVTDVLAQVGQSTPIETIP